MSTAAKPEFWVDTRALEKEIEEALERDRDYRLRNDAKFRAAAQKSATYEEFKGIVDLAHLQPLTREDYQKTKAGPSKTCQEPWTPLRDK